MEEENLFEYEGVSYPESSLREIYPEDFDKYVEQGVLTKVGGEEPVDVVDTQEESLYEYEGVSYPESSLREVYPDTFDDYVQQGVLTKVDSLGKPIAVEDSAAARDMDLVSEDGLSESQEKDTLLERTFGKNTITDFLGDLYRAGEQGFLQAEAVDPSINLMTEGADASAIDVYKYVQKNKEIARKSMESDEMKDFNRVYDENGGGAFGFLMGVIESPSVLPSLFVSSMATQIGSLQSEEVTASAAAGAGSGALLGLAGGPLAPLTSGTGAMMGGFGAGAAAMEAGLTFSELLEEQIEGELTPEKVRAVLNDPEKLSDLRMKAIGRGVAVGAVEGLSAGLAGKASKAVAGAIPKGKSIVGRAARKAAVPIAGGAVEVVGGMTGEVAGRLAADQEMDVKEIGFEGFAGLGSAPISILPTTIKNINIVSGRANAGKVAKKGGYNNVSSVFDPNTDIDETTMELAANKNTSNIVDEQVEIEVANGRMTQEESEAIKENFRATQGAVNTANKIDRLSKENKPEAVNLLIEEKKLKDKIKDVDNAALTKTESERLKEVQSRLEEISNPKEEELSETETEIEEETGVPPTPEEPASVETAPAEVEKLRAEEQAEMLEQVPGAENALTDGKVDKKKLTTEEGKTKFQEIYDKYNDKISPLLETAPAEEVEAEEEYKGFSFKPNYKPTTLKTPNSNIDVVEGAGSDSFEISTKNYKDTEGTEGATIIGYVKDRDFPGEKKKETRGEIFILQVNEKGKGTGTSLMLDALRLMKENGTETVKFTVPSKEGKPFNETLVNKGYIELIKVSERTGTSEYKITDKVLETAPVEEVSEATEEPTETTKAKLTGKAKVIAEFSETPKFKKETEEKIEEDTKDEVESVVEEMNQMSNELANFEVPSNLSTKEKSKLSSLVSRFSEKIKKLWKGGIIKDISEYNGIPFMFTISDQLSSGSTVNPFTGNTIDLQGGLGFSLTEGNEKNGWANTEEGKAEETVSIALDVYNKNKPLFDRLWEEGKLPYGHVPMAIVKMGQDSILSNEALFRVAADTIKTHFSEQERKNSLDGLVEDIQDLAVIQENNKRKNNNKEPLTDAEEKSIRDKVLSENDVIKFINDNKFTTIDQLLENLNKLTPITKRVEVSSILFTGSVGKDTTPGKPKKKSALALVEGKSKDFYKYIHVQQLNNIIKEEATENIPAEHIIGITSVDVVNSKVENVNHKNYPFGPKGQMIGFLESPVHVADVFPEAYSRSIAMAKEDKSGKLADPRMAVRQAVAASGAVATMKILRGAKLSDKISDFQKLVAKLRAAFPSVVVVDSSQEFNNKLKEPSINKFVKDGDTVYGFTYDGKIFINPELKNLNTPLHEFGHIWLGFLKENNPELLEKGYKLLEGTELLKRKIEEFGDTELAREEAMAESIASRGEVLIDASKISKFKEWLSGVFNYLKKKIKGFESMSTDEIQNMTLEEFVDKSLAAMLSGKEITSKQIKSIGLKFSKSGRSFTIEDVIKSSERENLTRKETIEVLEELGFTKDEIRSAMKPVKEKARSVASETTGLSPREAFKQGFTEFFDAIQRGKKEARQKAAENLKEKVNKVRESFKKKLQKEKDNKTARAAVVKEIRAIIKDSGLSRTSKRTINKIMTNVKNANVNNMQRMVDEVMDAINRDIDREARYSRLKTLKVAKNKLSRLGALKELQNPLMEVLSINPDYLSKTALKFYDRVVVNLANVEKKFDSRESREDLKNDAEEVIKKFTIDNAKAEELAEKTINPNLDLAKTKGENLKQMLKDGLISDSDFELMTRFKDFIGNTSKEELTLEELEQKAKERRDAAIEDFEAAMDEIPSSLPNLSRDDAEALRFANGLKMKDLESLSTAQIKMLTRGLEMLQAGFVTTNLVQSKTIVEAKREVTNSLINETVEKGKLDKSISSAKVYVQNIFRKRDKMITSIENRIKSTPLANIDQILNAGAKKFKSTRVYESIFRPAGVAFARGEKFLEDTKKKLQLADSYLSVSPNKKYVQKAKVMIYQIQREFESNKENSETKEAIEWIEATLNDSKSNISDREREAIEKIRDEFTVNGQIDSKKILDSLTDKEKKYMSIVDEVNKSVEFMVAADAKMQGKPFVLRENYVHLPKVTKSENSMSSDLTEIANSFINPALKNKALIQRTGEAHAISFDPTFNANAITKKAAISYYMYPAVKKAKIILAGIKENADTKFQKETADALENVFDGIIKSQYSHLSRERAFIEKALAYLGRAGYLAQLAGPVKAMVELTTNVTHALFVNPSGLISGFETLRSVDRSTINKALEYLPTTQESRLTGSGIRDSKETEGRLIDDSLNLFDQEEMTSELRAKVSTLFKFAKKPLNAIVKFNENLISRPDTIVATPLFVGVFNISFENIANEKPNWDKIANDQAYRDKFKDAINQATEDADAAVVDNTASNNPFDGIPKNILDKDATAVKQALQMTDRYMSRFRTFEYYSALKAIQALMGKGKLTPTQGAMLLTGTVVRLSLYKMGIDMVFSLIFSMMGIDEEEDEIDFEKDLTKGVLGAVATLALGRNIGNISQMPINFGAEWLNKEYGEGITREGEYNTYKDGIVFSKIPLEVKPQDNMTEKILASSLGSYTPMAKTLQRAGKLATRTATSKREETIDRNFGELTTRIPFEIAGNMGVIPGYKTLRKIYLKYLFGEANKK